MKIVQTCWTLLISFSTRENPLSSGYQITFKWNISVWIASSQSGKLAVGEPGQAQLKLGLKFSFQTSGNIQTVMKLYNSGQLSLKINKFPVIT